MAGGFKRITDYDAVLPADLPDNAVVYTVLPSESTPALIDRKWTWAGFKSSILDPIKSGDEIEDNAIIDRHLNLALVAPTSITEDTNQTLASIITVTNANNPKITAMTDTLFAYFDDGNDRLYAFTFTPGTGFVIEGNYLDPGVGSNDSSLTALSPTSVALWIAGDDKLYKYDWDGTDWTKDGTELAIATASGASIVALSATDIALYDNGNDELRRYSWNGSTWALVGTGLSVVLSSFAGICAMAENECVLMEADTDTLRTYKWIEKATPTWELQSVSETISSIGNPALVALNKNCIVLGSDSPTLNLRVFKRAKNSAYWNETGTYHLLSSGGYDPGLAAVPGYLIVTGDMTDDIRSFELGYDPYSDPPSPMFP